MKNRVLLEKSLRALAFDLPLYRELFSVGLAPWGSLLGLSSAGVESYLRGLTYRRLSNGKRFFVGRQVIFQGRERIRCGEDVCLYGFDYLNAERAQGFITIGERSHIDQFCVLYGLGGLEIGRFCAIASGVKIYSQSNQYKQQPEKRIIEQPILYQKVTIGDDVWIGANAVILPGVRIGNGTVIGAGAVVRQSVPFGAIAAGVPAKVIGWRRKPQPT